MAAYLYVSVAQLSGNDLDLLPGRGVFDPQQVLRQSLAKAPVDFRDRCGCRRRALEPAGVDPLLDGEMGLGLKLEVALLGVFAVVTLERALDVDRVGVVTFDQVALVAVHRPHEVGQ